MGGLIADEGEWAAFEVEWQSALDDLGITKMHMSACEAPRKQFDGWPRERRDSAIDRFREIVVKRRALMLISAVSQAAWDEATRQSEILRSLFPTPIDLCFNDCMQKAMLWRSGDQPERVVITFDTRDQNVKAWERRAGGYEERYPSRVAGFAFGSMEKVLPLQAADMVAYEAFVFQCERERLGGIEPVARRNFRLLLEGLPCRGGFYRPESLIAYAERIAEGVRAMPGD